MKSFKQLWLSIAREVLEETKGGDNGAFLNAGAGIEVCLMSGICDMTQQCAKVAEVAPEVWDKWLKDKFKQWPKFSGDVNYPVPSVTKDSDKMAYFFCQLTDLWSPFHPYGVLRRELLEFLIQEMEKEDEATWIDGGVDVHP